MAGLIHRLLARKPRPSFTDQEHQLIAAAAMARARESNVLAHTRDHTIAARAKVDRIQADADMLLAAGSTNRYIDMSLQANRDAVFIRLHDARRGTS